MKVHSISKSAHMKKLYFSAIYILSYFHAQTQELVYSDLQKTNFFGSKMDVIARNDKSIIVHLARYAETSYRMEFYRREEIFTDGGLVPLNTNPGLDRSPG